MFAKARSSEISLNSSSEKVTSIHGDLLNDGDVVQVMTKKLGTSNFRVIHWNLERISESNGYVGQYYNLHVTCTVNNDRTSEKFVLFAKTNPPSDKPQFDFAIRSDLINKEIRIYEDLMPRMGAGNGTDWKVDCYLGKKDIIIVLEDATHQDFLMADKYIPFDFDECAVLLRSLAQFHSRSLILDENLREQGKTIKDEYPDILREILYRHDEELGTTIIAVGIAGACNIVDLVEGLDDISKQRIKSRISKWSWHLPELLQPSNEYRNIACHRDVWANNFMLKRDATGRPVECCLVDFQCLSYLPPAVDFMFSLYMTTRRNIRDQHFEVFAKMYHEYVRNELDSGAGLDIDNCLSWEEFRKSCESYRTLAIIYAAINQPMMLMDQRWALKYLNNSPEFFGKTVLQAGPSLVQPHFNLVKEYRERLVENIFDINKWVPDDLP